jgi:hypothetical protein
MAAECTWSRERGFGGEFAHLDGDVARRRAIAVPICQAVNLIAYREAGGTEAQSDDCARDLVGRNRRMTCIARTIDQVEGLSLITSSLSKHCRLLRAV